MCSQIRIWTLLTFCGVQQEDFYATHNFMGKKGFWVILGSVLHWEDDDKLVFIQKHNSIHICVANTNAFLVKQKKISWLSRMGSVVCGLQKIISLRILISALLKFCRICLLKSEIILNRFKLIISTWQNALVPIQGMYLNHDNSYWSKILDLTTWGTNVGSDQDQF